MRQALYPPVIADYVFRFRSISVAALLAAASSKPA